MPTVLPYVMEYNADSCPEKMVELAKSNTASGFWKFR